MLTRLSARWHCVNAVGQVDMGAQGMKAGISSLDEAAKLLHAEVHGNAHGVSFVGISTDTREVAPGQLFVALSGPQFDGHDYVVEALNKGAVAAVVSHVIAAEIPQLVVDDTQRTYAQLAANWRQQFDIPLIAVTGSNGKTTVKEMLVAILSCMSGNMNTVLATQANFNNEVGVPRTLLGLRENHLAAVVEEGASQPGDIAYLNKFVEPTIAVITNASGAHLQGFGSVDVVAKTKGEIFETLSEKGLAIINADDEFAGVWKKQAGEHNTMSFGFSAAADVRGEITADGDVQIFTAQGVVCVCLPLEGRHNMMNALAACAAAMAAGASIEQVKQGLQSMRPVPGRLQRKVGVHGAKIIDDSYNANPASLNAALNVLAQCDGDRYLALGDMAELGAKAIEYHQQAGRRARDVGVHRLYAVGECSQHAARAFGEHGQHFSAQDEMISCLRDDLDDNSHKNVTLLIKGSRSAHMENVVAALSVTEPVTEGAH
jgi:UDP-N-acetylmuramoyl-tripeptide--D-alanyl-D-alanine ligase